MSDVGINPEHIGHAALVEHIRTDKASYDTIIREAGIKTDQ